MFTFEINSLLILSIPIIKSQKLNLACTATSFDQVALRLTLWTFLNKKESEYAGQCSLFVCVIGYLFHDATQLRNEIFKTF